MRTVALALKGTTSARGWRDLLEHVARAIGMSPSAPPAEWNYPMEGKGGSGLTIVQPITESFIALETWPDHGGAYLFVCSCMPIDGPRLIDAVIGRGFSPFGNAHATVLSLRVTND